jgi:hypothetical protein
VTVKRVHHRGSARAARAAKRRGWRLASVPAATGTSLRGRGVPRHKVLVTLARCTDGSARVAKRLRLRAGRDGIVRASSSARGLCVLRLQPV